MRVVASVALKRGLVPGHYGGLGCWEPHKRGAAAQEPEAAG